MGQTTDSVQSTTQPAGAVCDWIPATQSQCPTNAGALPDCHGNMSEGELCEADSPLPNGVSTYNINNCGSFDVFVYSCTSIQTSDSVVSTQPIVQTTEPVQSTDSVISTQQACNWIPVTQCPTNAGGLPNCHGNMSEGELCEADTALPNGDMNFEINNCGNYDVFIFSCSSIQSTDSIVSTQQVVQTTQTVQTTSDTCDWIPVTQCPTNAGALPNCHGNMSEGELCEADTALPNGDMNFEINNCGNYDVFVFSCTSIQSTDSFVSTQAVVQTTEPIQSTDNIVSTQQIVQTTQSGTCGWVPVTSSECPADNGKNLPECSSTMSEGDLCEADSALPNGNSVYNINNCGAYDVFKYSCNIQQAGCSHVPISSSECPADNGKNLLDCSMNMTEGMLCEADSALPNGDTNFNINNCGGYDVFRFTCSSSVDTTDVATTQQAGRRQLSEKDMRKKLRAKLPSGLERMRKH